MIEIFNGKEELRFLYSLGSSFSNRIKFFTTLLFLIAVEAVRSSPYTMTYTINYNVRFDWYGNLIAPGIIFLCPEGADMAMAGV